MPASCGALRLERGRPQSKKALQMIVIGLATVRTVSPGGGEAIGLRLARRTAARASASEAV
jgi:hypothetical protein